MLRYASTHSSTSIENIKFEKKVDCQVKTAKNSHIKIAKLTKRFEESDKHLMKLRAEFIKSYDQPIISKHSRTDFNFLQTIGRGTFGAVVLAVHKSSRRYYAVKIIEKGIIMNKHLEHMLRERKILHAIKFPFLINMIDSFKDNANVFFVLPFIPGGDLYGLLLKLKYLAENDVKFYAAQIVLGIEYLHTLNLIYRDLKPENICIDYNGYIKLVDFGFAKFVEQKTYTVCGTPEYLAPEIILYKGYDKSIDWWAFGVIIYELICGRTPFYDRDLMQLYERIVTAKFTFNNRFSENAKHLIRNILQIDLSKRFGNLRNGVKDIKSHIWLQVIDWNAIYTRHVVAPHIPRLQNMSDTKYYAVSEVIMKKASKELFPDEFSEF